MLGTSPVLHYILIDFDVHVYIMEYTPLILQ